MNQKDIFKLCKEQGCCDSCCLRFIGIKNYNSYENVKTFCAKFHDKPTIDQNKQPDTEQLSSSSDATVTSQSDDKSTQRVTKHENDVEMDAEDESNKNDVEMVTEAANGNGEDVNNGTGSPQAKRRKLAVCGTCLGLLEEDGWAESNATVKEVLDKKQYDSKSFGCGLSSPMCLLLREKVMCLIIKEVFPEYDENTVTSIKEAWKARHAPALARHLGLALDSGAVSALLLVLNMEYPDDIQELEILKPISPELFQSRSRQRKRFTVEFTRRSVEQALEGATLAALAPLGWGAVKGAKTRANCVSVTCTKAPMYLGGRYIKLSRELPQTPWLVQGERMMESSVQEIIFEPLAKLCGMSAAEAEHRLKFISAGREDVDVRCLGQGRPFAVEVLDPRRELTPEELQQICEIVSADGRVKLHQLVLVTKDDLAQLKAGEENKCKIYEAICIKLTHSKNGSDGHNGDTPIQVTDEDISKINSFRNTPEGDPARLMLSQKTPIRVLHRRPLLNRTKYVLDMVAQKVPGHPQLLVLRIRTSAGAYVKEFVHGELRRTTPSLGDAIQAQFDILALDVTDVQLDWPVIK